MSFTNSRKLLLHQPFLLPSHSCLRHTLPIPEKDASNLPKLPLPLALRIPPMPLPLRSKTFRVANQLEEKLRPLSLSGYLNTESVRSVLDLYSATQEIQEQPPIPVATGPLSMDSGSELKDSDS